MEAKQAAIEICHGPECRQFDAAELRRNLQARGRTTERGHCRGLCLYAPVVHIGERCIPEASIEEILAADN